MNKKIKTVFLSVFLIAICDSMVLSDEMENYNFSSFYQLIDTGDDDNAVNCGDDIYLLLVKKYRADAGFNALKSKLIAAEFLAEKMTSQLRKATSGQVFSMADQLFDSCVEKASTISVAPAKSFYDTSIEIFSKSVKIDKLTTDEKKFLAKYYDLKLRMFTNSIAKAGQALAVAEPSFKGTHDNILVLALLHASQTRPVNIEIMPKWMSSPDQLDVFSDSCLLHFGFAYHAHTFAKRSAKLSGREFSSEEFYRAAANKSKKMFPHVAVDCLERAAEALDKEKLDEKIDIYFQIVLIWLDSGNFKLAAGQAQNIVKSYGKHERAGDAIWHYYFALSKSNDTKSILKGIDVAIKDSRSQEYKSKLMYMKWWALRRQRTQPAAIAVIEHDLLRDFKEDPIIAPILLSKATDYLASQDYLLAMKVLEDISKRFPNTSAAGQAVKMTEKLKALKNI